MGDVTGTHCRNSVMSISLVKEMLYSSEGRCGQRGSILLCTATGAERNGFLGDGPRRSFLPTASRAVGIKEKKAFFLKPACGNKSLSSWLSARQVPQRVTGG